jgi:hypothetical protein
MSVIQQSALLFVTLYWETILVITAFAFIFGLLHILIVAMLEYAEPRS